VSLIGRRLLLSEAAPGAPHQMRSPAPTVRSVSCSCLVCCRGTLVTVPLNVPAGYQMLLLPGKITRDYIYQSAKIIASNRGSANRGSDHDKVLNS